MSLEEKLDALKIGFEAKASAKAVEVIRRSAGKLIASGQGDVQALEGAQAQIQARSATLAVISEQTPANSRKSKRDNNLGFPILTIDRGDVAAAFGICWEVKEELKASYTEFGVDLRKFIGEVSWTLPTRARHVMRHDGVIAYAEINPDYTHRPDPSELLPPLDRLRQTQAA